MGRKNPPLVPPYNGKGGIQLCFSFLKLRMRYSLIEKFTLQEADNFACLRFNAFDFQLKFSLKHTDIVLIKEN